MTEYGNSIFYKIKFDIYSEDSKTDFVWKVIYHVKNWLTRKWNSHDATILPQQNNVWGNLKYGGILQSSDKKSVYIKTVAHNENDDNMIFWACRISENPTSDNEYAPREWITEIGIEPIDVGLISFSYVVSYKDRPGFIGLCEDEPSPNIPNVVRNLLADKFCDCKYGDDLVSIEPTKLVPGDWKLFWEKVVSKNRVIPYIFLSMKYDSEKETMVNLVDPALLTTAAGGNALVFYSEDEGVIEEMDYFCPAEYRCYGGAIRIYYPDVNVDDPLDSHRHRYISADNISLWGEYTVIKMIRRALAQDVYFREKLFSISSCEQKRDDYFRKLRIEQLHREHEHNIKQQESEWIQLAEDEEEKRIKTEDDMKHIKDELKTVKDENHSLSAQIDSYRSLAEKNSELEKICSNRLAIKDYPDDPQDIVNYFEAIFGNRLAFSDDAKKSLKNCTIPSSDLWKIFFCLATEMYDLHNEVGGDIYGQFKEKTGIDVARSEGSMTRKDTKLMRQFVTEYYGEEIDIEPHITFPKIKQSIHFGFSSKNQKVVIGSCGEHKKIYSTRKNK